MTRYEVYFLNGDLRVKKDVDTSTFKGSNSIDETFDTNSFVIPFDTQSESYLPNTKVIIKESYEQNGETVTKEYFRYLTSDIVTQVGFGDNKLYNHNIVVTENTVILKQKLCESIAVTQPLGYVDTEDGTPTDVDIEWRDVIVNTPLGRVSLETAETTLTFIQIKDIYELASSAPLYFVYESKAKATDLINREYESSYQCLIRIVKGSQEIYSGIIPLDFTYTFNQVGTYDVYYYNTATWNTDADNIIIYSANNWKDNWSMHCAIKVYTEIGGNRKGDYFTVGEVCDKLRYTVKPLRGNEVPEYYFSDDTLDKLNELIAPEEYFTEQYLYENLLQVGKHIHAIPRIKEGTWNEIVFDYLTATKTTDITAPHIAYSATINSEEHTPCLVSNVENAVTNVSLQQSTIVEDYKHFASREPRLTDSSIFIETTQPIFKPKKLYLKYDNVEYDATNYLVDATTYSTLSRTQEISNSIAYKIYYTYGTRKIDGLTQKVDATLTTAFKYPAMVNILHDLILKNGGTTTKLTIASNYWYSCEYKIEYQPIVSCRVMQFRTDANNFKEPETNLVFNQSAQIVDITALGANLAGTIAKIGNQQLQKTYLFDSLSEVPKIGTIDGDTGYYIAETNIEYANNQIKCTVILSKDWNKLNEYIGIDSQIRYAQVSENKALRRIININDFVVIGKTLLGGSANYLYNKRFCNIPLGDTFRAKEDRTASLPKYATIKMIDKFGNNCLNTNDFLDFTVTNDTAIALPVQPFGAGNSFGFIWQIPDYDNYSCGKAFYKSGDLYYNVDIPYADWAGRIEKMKFSLTDALGTNTLPLPLYSGGVEDSDSIGTGSNDLIIKKDNREGLGFTYQLNPIITDDSIFLGQGFSTRNNIVVDKSTVGTIKTYYLRVEINKFYEYNESDVVSEATLAITDYSYEDKYVSTAIYPIEDVPENAKSYIVVENHNVTMQDGSIKNINDVLIGRNLKDATSNFITFYYVSNLGEIND